MSISANNVALTQNDVQRDLGLLVNKNLTWNENYQHRKQKALGALFQMRQNLSKECHWRTKLNAY